MGITNEFDLRLSESERSLLAEASALLGNQMDLSETASAMLSRGMGRITNRSQKSADIVYLRKRNDEMKSSGD